MAQFEQAPAMMPLADQPSPRGVAERVDFQNFGLSLPAPKNPFENAEGEEHQQEQPQQQPRQPGKVRWTFQKPMCKDRFFQYLQPSLASGHMTNGGPLQAVLEEKLMDFVGLASMDGREAVLACNGTAAVHGLVVGLSLQQKRSLKWVTQAFAFPSSCQGPLCDVKIIDNDAKLKGPSMQVLEATKDTFDGIIVTNMFGLQVRGILQYEEWCEKNGKLLILDNAATPLGTVEDGRNIHQVGAGSMVSLHETKVIGRGEGGAVFVDPDLAPFVRQAISFGYNPKDAVRVYNAACNNGKMSDIAAAGCCDHLDYMVENHWRERFQQQMQLAMEVMEDESLEFALPANSPTMLSCLFLDLKSSCAEVALQRLQACGIEAKRYYMPLVSRQEAPEAWRWFDQTICVPFHLAVSEEQLRFELKIVGEVVVEGLRTENCQSQLDLSDQVASTEQPGGHLPTASTEQLGGPVPTASDEQSGAARLIQEPEKVFVVGAGGLGRSIQAWFPDQVSGFIDDHSTETTVNGVRILGGTQWLIEQANTNCDQEISVVIGIGGISATEKIVSTLQESSNRFVFPTLVHSTALVAPTAEIQEGVVLMPQSMVAPNASVGRFTLLNTAASVSHDAKVGDFCRIHGGARILGWCSVGSRAMVGSNSVIKPGIKAAESTSLGCGSALVKDVIEAGTVLGGVPAKDIVARQVSSKSANSALVHPLHGQVIEETLSTATLDIMREAIRMEENGPPGYYSKTVYDLMAYKKSEELKSFVARHLPGYRPISDMLLLQEGADSGYAWHTDYLSSFYLEDPTDMVCVWVPLVDVSEETGGRLMFTTSAESFLLARMETYSKLYHEHMAAGVVHPFGGKVLPLLDKSKKAQNVKAGQALVFSNHAWHRAEPLKKDGFSRPAYVIRMVRNGARYSRRRANHCIRTSGGVGGMGPVARLMKEEPECFVEDENETEYSKPGDISLADKMGVFKDWMSHYSFQESSVTRLLIDAADSLKTLSSSKRSVSLPPCLEASHVPQMPQCLVEFADSLRNPVSSSSRLADFHQFIEQVSVVSALTSSTRTEEELDKIFAGTFAQVADSRDRARQLYRFLCERPEWSFQLRLFKLDGPMGFFHPPGWTVETLEQYLNNTKLLVDQGVLEAWKEQTSCFVAKLTAQ